MPGKLWKTGPGGGHIRSNPNHTCCDLGLGIGLVRVRINARRSFQSFLLKLHNSGKTLLFGQLLDSNVDFCWRRVVLVPKPRFLLCQEPSLSWVLLRLAPEKKAQVRAADFLTRNPGCPDLH